MKYRQEFSDLIDEIVETLEPNDGKWRIYQLDSNVDVGYRTIEFSYSNMFGDKKSIVYSTGRANEDKRKENLTFLTASPKAFEYYIEFSRLEKLSNYRRCVHLVKERMEKLVIEKLMNSVGDRSEWMKYTTLKIDVCGYEYMVTVDSNSWPNFKIDFFNPNVETIKIT